MSAQVAIVAGAGGALGHATTVTFAAGGLTVGNRAVADPGGSAAYATIAFLVGGAAVPLSGAIQPACGAQGNRPGATHIPRRQGRGQLCACPAIVRLNAARESPGSGDDLSPGWRRAWARREGTHAVQGTCHEIQGRYRDITSLRRPHRRRPARLRAGPRVSARPSPQRSGVLRRTCRAEPLPGHRRCLPVGVPDHNSPGPGKRRPGGA